MSHSKKELEELREEQSWKKIDEAVIESEHFIERNLKVIIGVVVAVVVVACAYFAYDHFVAKPQNRAAQVAMIKGEEFFRMGLDSLAVHGDGNSFDGFEAISKKYSSTKAGELAKLYAGISYARMGQAETALTFLKGYSGSDLVVSKLIDGTIGDCLVQTGKSEEAIAHFKKAAKAVDNKVQSPILYKKAAEISRSLGKHDDVIEIFTLVKDRYSDSPIAMEADKYIEEAKLLKK